MTESIGKLGMRLKTKREFCKLLDGRYRRARLSLHFADFMLTERVFVRIAVGHAEKVAHGNGVLGFVRRIYAVIDGEMRKFRHIFGKRRFQVKQSSLDKTERRSAGNGFRGRKQKIKCVFIDLTAGFSVGIAGHCAVNRLVVDGDDDVVAGNFAVGRKIQHQLLEGSKIIIWHKFPLFAI